MKRNIKNPALRLVNAFRNSWDGLAAAFKSEPPFQQELLLCAALIPIALWLDVGTIQQILLISSLIFVLICELVNTAIETTIDRISEDLHPLSKKAKDIGSAVVLLAITNAGFVWGIILFNGG